ncbi:MAG: HD domain-containing protein [Candidatus Doudnabacteria bacterium]|nr:HD domain-containing protein [Candidatus Doudnabacteria bacterium]
MKSGSGSQKIKEGGLHEDVYVPFDLNNPVEKALFRKLGSVVSDDRSKLKEWGAHCWRVALLTTLTAIALGRPMDQAVDYGVAAYLHDLGKFDPEIAHLFRLMRKLTPEEKAQADKHSYLGALKARRIYGDNYEPRKLRLIITGHLTHHIHYGGGWLNEISTSLLYQESGPKFLQGKNIPRIGRIIHVADSFDSMVRKRHYKTGFMSVEESCAELRKHAGDSFDPSIVETFIQILPKFVQREQEELLRQAELEYRPA